MNDLYADRPLWKARLYGLTLAAALLGLAGCLAEMGWLCCTM